MGMGSPLTEHSGGNDRRPFLRKVPFGEQIREFWRDLQKDHAWKYRESSPDRLLEGSNVQVRGDNDEMVRASWFWSRRPRLLHEHGLLVWSLIALAPVCIFLCPLFGVPVSIMAVAVVQIGIVRTARWRRDYERSIDRLIRGGESGGDTFEHHMGS
jgi:hypothetical protein